MNNSLNRLIDGIIIALEREIVPHVDNAYARGQAFAVMDLLRNMKPRLEWSREVILAQVGLQEAALERVERLCSGQAIRPPAMPPAPAPANTLGADKLEAWRNQLEAHVCELLRWMDGQRARMEKATAAAVEKTLTDYMREALKREMALTANPLFAEISRGKNS